MDECDMFTQKIDNKLSELGYIYQKY